jgi:hypothetical protein
LLVSADFMLGIGINSSQPQCPPRPIAEFERPWFTLSAVPVAALRDKIATIVKATIKGLG